VCVCVCVCVCVGVCVCVCVCSSMSPEVCENKPYSFASDIWALGCVLYEMCVLKHAFDANNLLGLVWKIVQETYPPVPEQYSEDLRQLVQVMLNKDPAKRPTIDDILQRDFIRKRISTMLKDMKTHLPRKGSGSTINRGRPSSAGNAEAISTDSLPSLLRGGNSNSADGTDGGASSAAAAAAANGPYLAATQRAPVTGASSLEFEDDGGVGSGGGAKRLPIRLPASSSRTPPNMHKVVQQPGAQQPQGPGYFSYNEDVKAAGAAGVRRPSSGQGWISTQGPASMSHEAETRMSSANAGGGHARAATALAGRRPVLNAAALGVGAQGQGQRPRLFHSRQTSHEASEDASPEDNGSDGGGGGGGYFDEDYYGDRYPQRENDIEDSAFEYAHANHGYNSTAVSIMDYTNGSSAVDDPHGLHGTVTRRRAGNGGDVYVQSGNLPNSPASSELKSVISLRSSSQPANSEQ